MSRQNRGYIARRNAEKSIRASSHEYATGLAMDCTIIALGQLGMDPEFLHKFKEEWNSVFHDVVKDIMEADYKSTFTNSRSDKTGASLNFVYTKETIDNLVKQYILPEDYVEFDYRYGLKEMPNDRV